MRKFQYSFSVGAEAAGKNSLPPGGSFRKLQSSTMVQTQSIQLDSDNKAGKCPAVLCGDLKSTTRGLIIIQEWWGMNQQIQDCGAELASNKACPMVTLVPDLYRGKVATDNEAAGHLMEELDWPGAVKDIQACARYLKSQGLKKVGVTGFCMGGALSLAAAALVPEIDAASAFYGIPSPELCDVTTIKIPLQCHFAKKDETKGFASPAEWEPLQSKLQASVKDLDFNIYDAGHAFTNKTGANYDKGCADVAFDCMFKFFNKNLA